MHITLMHAHAHILNNLISGESPTTIAAAPDCPRRTREHISYIYIHIRVRDYKLNAALYNTWSQKKKHYIISFFSYQYLYSWQCNAHTYGNSLPTSHMFYIEHSPVSQQQHTRTKRKFFFISGVKIDSISNKHAQCAKQFVAAEAKWKKNILLYLLNYNNLCLRIGCNVLATI